MKVLCDIQYLLYINQFYVYTLLLLYLLLLLLLLLLTSTSFLSRNLLVGFVARRPAAAHPVLQRHLLYEMVGVGGRSVMSLSICMECP
jgi:hypothetical protein